MVREEQIFFKDLEKNHHYAMMAYRFKNLPNFTAIQIPTDKPKRHRQVK